MFDSIHSKRNSGQRAALLSLVFLSFFSSAAMGWSIAGTVKSTDGSALADVSITVKDTAKYTATSGAGGAFSLQGPVGVLDLKLKREFVVQVAGSDLVVLCPKDGALLLSLVDASGDLLWNTEIKAVQGAARVSIPTNLRHGAAFMRILHSEGVYAQAVLIGSDGWKIAKHLGVAARTQAEAYPTIVFRKTGYNDTTFTMTSATQTGISIVMKPSDNCPFPTTFKWTDNAGGPVATPANGWTSIKDFTGVVYNGQHIIYMTMYKGAYGSSTMAPFTNWTDAAKATQTKMGTSTVAPELMYFTPKQQWILSYQWGAAKFSYGTSTTATGSFAFGKNLLTEDVVNSSTGPIDQVLICDKTNCYLFYAGDNGKIYRASMPIGNFPGNFTGSKMIMSDTQANLFEAVEVYTIKGANKYLMIVEAMGGGGRYFRAFTATSLDGSWTAVPGANTEASPFAGKKNVTFTTNWTNDISHGDLIRSHDETRTIDPCNLQLMYQGYNPSFTGAYNEKPYRMGLLTFKK